VDGLLVGWRSAVIVESTLSTGEAWFVCVATGRLLPLGASGIGRLRRWLGCRPGSTPSRDLRLGHRTNPGCASASIADRFALLVDTVGLDRESSTVE
jgi:hypothetical protein